MTTFLLYFSWPYSRCEDRPVEEAPFLEDGDVFSEIRRANGADSVHVNGDVDLFAHPFVSVG